MVNNDSISMFYTNIFDVRFSSLRQSSNCISTKSWPPSTSWRL